VGSYKFNTALKKKISAEKHEKGFHSTS